MEGTTRVLLVEDDKIDQMAFKRMVKNEKLSYDYTIAGSFAEAKKILESGEKFDIILLDYHLGDGNSLELLTSFDSIETPLIFATGAGNEEVAVKAMKSGAYDYLIKDPERNYLKILGTTVENAINRKRANEQLRMLSHAVMSATDSIYITDMTDKIIFVNKAFCQTYGYVEEDILGSSCRILYADTTDDDLKDSSPTPLAKGEFYHKRNSGQNFPVALSRSVIKDEKGQESSIVTVARDITTRKQVEQALRELNAGKDKFFSIISHDLRSPFAHLLGFSEVLHDELDTLAPDQIKDFANSINRAAKRLFTLLENLLQWSTIQTGRIEYQPGTVELSELIEDVIELLAGNAAGKKIRLSSELEGNVAVYVDRNMISSVIRNLTSNAIKFTNSGGTVEIVSKRNGEFVEVSVSDTGVGMSRADIDKLFRIDMHHIAYGTAQEKGSGLGLILCKEFVERNGGKIWVESKVGQGTTFKFTLAGKT